MTTAVRGTRTNRYEIQSKETRSNKDVKASIIFNSLLISTHKQQFRHETHRTLNGHVGQSCWSLVNLEITGLCGHRKKICFVVLLYKMSQARFATTIFSVKAAFARTKSHTWTSI